MFLGVPHCGSDLEAWATFGRRMVSIFAPANKDIVNVLNPDSEMLHMVENNFHTIVRQRKDDPIKLTCFYEELAVKGIGEVVDIHLIINRTIDDLHRLCLNALPRSRATTCMAYMQTTWYCLAPLLNKLPLTTSGHDEVSEPRRPWV